MSTFGQNAIDQLVNKYGYTKLSGFGPNGEDYYFRDLDDYGFTLKHDQRVDEDMILMILELASIPYWEFDNIY